MHISDKIITLDTVQNGVVPIAVKTRNFAVRVEPQNVAVRNLYVVYVLTLLSNGRDFSGYGPAHLGLDHDCVPCGAGIISMVAARKMLTVILSHAPDKNGLTAD
jgi:hypothetical protein